MSDRLQLYNAALRLIGDRRLASLTEDTPGRRVLDDVWAAGLVRRVLAEAPWSFAIRTASVAFSADIEPGVGYLHAFEQPDDFVRTASLSTDEFGHVPLNRYEAEAGYWYADEESLFARYVSDGADYGGDLSRWPEKFTAWVEVHLALQIARSVANLSASDLEELRRLERSLKAEAKASDAAEQPTRYPPVGAWVRARFGWGRYRDQHGYRV